MKYGLKEQDIEKINNILASHSEIEKVVLYGSRAKGNYRNGSDIDLCLFGKEISLSLQFMIENELDDLLLPNKIDISIFERVENSNLVEHIKRIGIIFYQKT